MPRYGPYTVDAYAGAVALVDAAPEVLAALRSHEPRFGETTQAGERALSLGTATNVDVAVVVRVEEQPDADADFTGELVSATGRLALLNRVNGDLELDRVLIPLFPGRYRVDVTHATESRERFEIVLSPLGAGERVPAPSSAEPASEEAGRHALAQRFAGVRAEAGRWFCFVEDDPGVRIVLVEDGDLVSVLACAAAEGAPWIAALGAAPTLGDALELAAGDGDPPPLLGTLPLLMSRRLTAKDLWEVPDAVERTVLATIEWCVAQEDPEP